MYLRHIESSALLVIHNLDPIRPNMGRVKIEDLPWICDELCDTEVLFDSYSAFFGDLKDSCLADPEGRSQSN